MDEKKSLKEKVEQLKLNASYKWQQTKSWCKENKETLLVLAPIVGGVTLEILKEGVKAHNVKSERKLKENYIYDRQFGHYYELKRQPKPSEWISIENRKDSGENLGQILNSMRLIK